ncbi:MAG: GvpL/GvpF family gas vesicle protein, partial [Bacteroidota bacterium]|nr:GvpL/GvpF family gas vesicle protein [Bacteroidota bacterium]
KSIALLSGMKGIAGAELVAVSFDQISAVVSDLEKADLIANQTNAFAFASVIENVEQQYPLLPMRFGSIMESTDSVQQMLEKNYPEFQNNLQKVENKSEFGLKIFCDTEKLKAELKSKSEAMNETSQKPASESKDSVFKEYINQKLKAHRLEEMLLNYVDSIIAEFTGFLVQLEAVKKIKKMTTATTIIDAVFLLEKDKKAELIQAIEDLQRKYTGLNFILTGPWPPYSFVDITLK